MEILLNRAFWSYLSKNSGYGKELGVEEFIEAYIQSIILKRTYKSISIDFRHTSTLVGSSRDEVVNAAVERIYEQVAMVAHSNNGL